MTMASEKQMEKIGASRGCEDHDFDLVHELDKPEFPVALRPVHRQCRGELGAAIVLAESRERPRRKMLTGARTGDR